MTGRLSPFLDTKTGFALPGFLSVKVVRKTSFIGLDLGTSSVKMVEVVRRERGPRVQKAEAREWNQAAGPASLESALRSLLKGSNPRKSRFVVALSGDQTAMRVVTVPLMPRRELRDSVRLEAKNYFPFPVEDSSLDFEILGEIVEEGIRKLRVAVATISKESVQACLGALRKLGVKPLSVIPMSQALAKLAGHSDAKKSETYCLVDIGRIRTECIILKGGQLVFSRRVMLGGDDFTKALTNVVVSEQGRMALTGEEAEKIKRDLGVPEEGETRAVGPGVSMPQILSLLRGPLESLASEIGRCFDYHREETTGGTVESVWLIGGGASLKGLAKYLSESLGIEAHLGFPAQALRTVLEGFQPPPDGMHSYAAALGAALSFGEGLNLLPPEVKEETLRALQRATWQAFLTAGVLLAILLYIGIRLQLGSIQKKVDVARLELSSLKYDLAKASVQSDALAVLAQEPYWEDVFRDLSHLIPKEIYLAKLSLKERNLYLQGRIMTLEKEGVLSDFILRLENGIFKNVSLVSAKELPDQSATDFELECWVD